MGYDGDESEDDAGVDEGIHSEGGTESVESEAPAQEGEPGTDASEDDEGNDDRPGRRVVTPKDMEDYLEDHDDFDAEEALRQAREMSQRMSRMMQPYIESWRDSMSMRPHAQAMSESFRNVSAVQSAAYRALTGFQPPTIPLSTLLNMQQMTTPWQDYMRRGMTFPVVPLPALNMPWLKQAQAMTSPAQQMLKSFSVSNPVQQMLESFAEQTRLPDLSWFRKALERRVVPDNLAELGLDDDDLDDVVGVLDDGIPLFWVPRASIARRLLEAEDINARKKVIGDEMPAILDDCRDVLDLVTDPDYLYWADCLREAAELVGSHPRAAQVLATATLDSQLYRIKASLPQTYTVVASASGRSKAGHEDKARADLRRHLGMRAVLALSAARPLYVQSSPSKPEPPPKELNKHASFHKVHPFQYSPHNATIAVMLGSSVLLYLSRWFEIELQQAKNRVTQKP